ncbi:hypothetical protein JD844_034345 [Phrynosoma platyrhinos]|uniref:Alkaline ceramidase n=1 Tax=Phrynosoma platyrhinos TaxID=52577 RepID=A0ABQ7T940_PHRPL|nr:hypothetical protein JD844_034345 [Phrynosoma platyrhinos]
MPSIFAYQSAEVDWCEGNFERSEYIAEYYNTISNVAFFILAPVLMWLNSSYRDFRPNPVHTLFVVQLCIGAFSLYYHMTLSYAGQLLDELSILWGVSICYAFWFPVRYFPGFIKNSCKNPRIHRVAACLVIWWLISISCWLADKHLFINVTIFYCATLVMYFDVLYEMPNSQPLLTYWPSETSFFALPYVVVQKSQKWF